MFRLKLGLNDFGRIFEADSSLLGKLCEKLEKGQSYTLQRDSSNWIVVKLGKLEKQLLTFFPGHKTSGQAWNMMSYTKNVWRTRKTAKFI